LLQLLLCVLSRNDDRVWFTVLMTIESDCMRMRRLDETPRSPKLPLKLEALSLEDEGYAAIARFDDYNLILRNEKAKAA
jgi:hypothetical protein